MVRTEDPAVQGLRCISSEEGNLIRLAATFPREEGKVTNDPATINQTYVSFEILNQWISKRELEISPNRIETKKLCPLNLWGHSFVIPSAAAAGRGHSPLVEVDEFFCRRVGFFALFFDQDQRIAAVHGAECGFRLGGNHQPCVGFGALIAILA